MVSKADFESASDEFESLIPIQNCFIMDIQTMIMTNSPDLKKIDKGEIALKVLEMLTPGGSEFFNDPVRCYEHIKDRFETSHKMILKLHKENK